MSEINKIIIEMLQQNKSMKEICILLKLSQKQFYVRLKQIINYGYQFIPSYSYNSDIYYKLEKGFYVPEENSVKIKIPSSSKEFRCLVTSDLHIGNKDADINLSKYVYEYASKNEINNILIVGDLIEGVHSTDIKSIKDINSQIETFIKKYPYDKNINNYVILGNHDYHSLHHDGLDISKRIIDSRYDIIPIGYGKGIVKLKDDSLLLQHELSLIDNPNIGSECKLVLVGHGHMMKTKAYENFYICVPTLSYDYPDKNIKVMPGFLDMKISFQKNMFEFVEAKHLIFTPEICQVSETRCRIKKLYKDKEIYNNTNKWNY